jgi:signal transduction histidine kinase
LADDRAIDYWWDAPVGFFRATRDRHRPFKVDTNLDLARTLGFGSPQELREFINVHGVRTLWDYSPLQAESLREGLRSGGWHQFEMHFRRRDGGGGVARLTMRSVTAANEGLGKPERRVEGFLEDLTQLQRSGEEARRHWQSESLERLAGAIGHKFNNINTIVMGYLGIAIHDPLLPGEYRSYLETAFHGARRIAEITARLQAFNRISRIDHGDLRLDEALAESVRRLSLEAALDGVTVSWQPASTMSVVVDWPTADFVLKSLVQNSVHALTSRPKRIVVVRTRDEAQRSCLQVTDHGCGIAAEDIPKVFTPFFSRKGEWAPAGSNQVDVLGMGLSLAIAYRLVEAVGGTIELESKENVGTTVTAWFRRSHVSSGTSKGPSGPESAQVDGEKP